MMHAAALALALLALLAVGPAPAAAALVSQLWGVNGELYNPAGRLLDFSFAGYRQGAVPLPTPPATRSVFDHEFLVGERSVTEVFQKALAWAHAQPVVEGTYLVLTVPPGEFILTDRLFIQRSYLVLRGAGSGLTTLRISKTLLDLLGPNPDDPHGFYVNNQAYITMRGTSELGRTLAKVTGSAAKGTRLLTLDSTANVAVGQMIQLQFKDVGGAFNDYMLGGGVVKWTAPAKYKGQTRCSYTSRITAINGNMIQLERYLPYDINAKMVSVTVTTMPDTVHESGVEGLTFKFDWSLYPGHHCEHGYNAVYVKSVYDCWVRDIATINPDNTVLVNGCTSVTVQDVVISVTKTRANNIPNQWGERADSDSHRGLQAAHSYDVLFTGFQTTCAVLHDVGTDAAAKWIVFANGTMQNGNLDLHRGLSGPSLYTGVDVGLGTEGLYSGGPKASGPNAAAGTTWWGIKSKIATGMTPNKSDGPAGSCTFGPVINLVGLNLNPHIPLCKTWLYERGVATPFNLYEAQKARRLRLQADGTW